VPSPPDPLARAYAACVALARAHYENFPVASWLLPRAMRPHVAAVYAFARIADDIADEGTLPAEERRRQLDAWQARLHAALAAAPAAAEPVADEQALMLMALAHSIRTLDLPITLFDDLVSAFAQDTTTSRYDSWDEVFEYCRRSANPVGRLVLRIAGCADAALDRSSDALCTALQLTNFWQDFGRDWLIGRLYVPRDAIVLNRAREMDLNGAMLPGEWLAVLDGCLAVTRQQFALGRAVCDGVRGRLRYQLRLTWHGGMRVLDAVEEAAPYLLRYRPALGLRDAPPLLWRAFRWTDPS
jgi:squalene synthase HpnC